MPKSVVILGGGVGALSAAIFAKLQGCDVLLLEKGSKVGGKAAGIERAGYALDPGPSIIILPRLYEGVFRAAGRRMDDYLQFQRLDPFSRVFFQGREAVDLPSDRTACEQVVRTVAPEDYESFVRMMGTLEKVSPHIDKSVFARPYTKPWELADPHLIATALQFDVRVTYKDLVDRWFKSPLLRSFFYGFPSYGGQTYDSKAPGALMIPYLMIQEGVYYPVGGVASIPKAFESLARELGVEIRTDSEVVRIETNSRRVSAVVTSTGERYEGDAFISNIDRITTGKWLGRSTEYAPSLSYFTLHWGVRRRIDEIEHHTLLVPNGFESGFEALYRRREFPEPPIVYLNATSKLDPSVAPKGCTNLFAVVTSPAKEAHLDWERQKVEFRESVLRTMDGFGFGLEDSELDFERIQTPDYFASQHGNYQGSLYGPDETQRLFGGLFPLSNRDDTYQNLAYCGGSVQPGAGLPMVTLSGRFAVEALKNELR